MVKKIPMVTWNVTRALVLFLWESIKNPRVLKDKLAEAQHLLKEVWLVRQADGLVKDMK